MPTSVDTMLSSPFFVMHFISFVLLGYWIVIDAKARGSDSAVFWAAGCLFIPLLIIGYLLYRSEIGTRTTKANKMERVVGVIVIANFIAVILRFILTLSSAYPVFVNQPIAELPYYLFLFIIGIIPGFLLVWRNGWAQIRHRLSNVE